MNNRRSFLKQIGVGALSPALRPAMAQQAGGAGMERLGFKPHPIKQGDGRGGWIIRAGEYQFLHHPAGRYVMPFGIAQMDNGELILAASWHDGTAEKAAEAEKPVVAFSRDRGRTWTEFQRVEGAGGRPMSLTYLGKGKLTFHSDLLKQVTQFRSRDYGRTWTERNPLQLAENGQPFNTEGNVLVDRDAGGQAVRIAMAGYYYPPGMKWPKDPATGVVRWSSDEGRTWTNETRPPNWRWPEQHGGKQYIRGISEGSLIRAANGWVVAALRTDIPARYLEVPHDDSLEGTGISISKDDGRTWSDPRILYDAGRHHAHLLRLPNGTLVMTLIVRDDVRNRELASYRRGCEAILSRDNGETWDLEHKYVLDDFEFYDGRKWFNSECGHLYSALFDDGNILTCYGKYLSKGASLIRWQPTNA
jgi:hypothetical protein